MECNTRDEWAIIPQTYENECVRVGLLLQVEFTVLSNYQ